MLYFLTLKLDYTNWTISRNTLNSSPVFTLHCLITLQDCASFGFSCELLAVVTLPNFIFNYTLPLYWFLCKSAYAWQYIWTMYYDIICTLSLDIRKRRIYWLESCCPKTTYILYQLGFLLHYNYTYFDYKRTLVHLTYLYTYKTYNTCIILNKLSSQSVFLLKLSFYLDDEDDDKNC